MHKIIFGCNYYDHPGYLYLKQEARIEGYAGMDGLKELVEVCWPKNARLYFRDGDLYGIGFKDVIDYDAFCVSSGISTASHVGVKEQRIVGVAYRVGKLVISAAPPNRHHNILQEVVTAFNLDHWYPTVQDSGFILQDGRFVNRGEAFIIASDNGQLLTRLPGQYDGPDLYSEDLW